MEKLKGIKVDLVYGKEDWQDWDLVPLIKEIKRWRDINSCFNSPPKKNKLYYAKDGKQEKWVYVYFNASDHYSKDC